MILILFSCLQGVQTEPVSNSTQDLCTSICTAQEQACQYEQSCETRCTSLVSQLTSKDCTNEAEELWQCQSQGSWSCVGGNAKFEGDDCLAREEKYLECITPGDTGAATEEGER